MIDPNVFLKAAENLGKHSYCCHEISNALPMETAFDGWNYSDTEYHKFFRKLFRYDTQKLQYLKHWQGENIRDKDEMQECRRLALLICYWEAKDQAKKKKHV